MKKLLAVFLSLVMMLTFIPYGVSAAEVGDSRETDLIAKAADVFPEHADKLLNSSYTPSTHSGNSTARTLIASETRPVSSNEYVTYSEYSDGLILLSDYEFTSDTKTVSSSSSSGNKYITVDVTAACVNGPGFEGYFYLKGLSYTLRSGLNNYDSITNEGTPSKGTNCANYTRISCTPNETLHDYAQLHYKLSFRIGSGTHGQYLESSLTIFVGTDTAWILHTAAG